MGGSARAGRGTSGIEQPPKAATVASGKASAPFPTRHAFLIILNLLTAHTPHPPAMSASVRSGAILTSSGGGPASIQLMLSEAGHRMLSRVCGTQGRHTQEGQHWQAEMWWQEQQRVAGGWGHGTARRAQPKCGRRNREGPTSPPASRCKLVPPALAAPAAHAGLQQGDTHTQRLGAQTRTAGCCRNESGMRPRATVSSLTSAPGIGAHC